MHISEIKPGPSVQRVLAFNIGLADTPEGCPYGDFCRFVNWLILICSIEQPFLWVVFYVLPYFIIVLLISDYVVVKPLLPDVLAVFLITKPLESSYKAGDYGGPFVAFCRDTPPGVSVHVMDSTQS